MGAEHVRPLPLQLGDVLLCSQMISLFGIKHVKRLACLVLASILTFETLCLFVGGRRAEKK